MSWKIKSRERYALIEQDEVNPLKHRGTFFIGPRHVKHHSTKEFIEFTYVTAPNFASESNCRVFAQNSHVAIEVYDYYTKLFDPDYQTVSVYDERFTVQYLFKEPNTWRDVGAWNPTIQVIPLEDGVEIKKIFDTDYGTGSLEISYVVRTGAFLKHNIVFLNKTTDTKTFRVVMKLAGITGTKLTHSQGKDLITVSKSLISPYFFVSSDTCLNTLSVYLWSLGIVDEVTNEWSADKLQNLVFDIHVSGSKCDIIIGNWSLGENENLAFDPNFSTFAPSLPLVYSKPHTALGSVYCASENLVIGESVSGDHTTTHELDGVYRQIDEVKVVGKYELEVQYDFEDAGDRTKHNTVTHDAYCYYTEGADIMVIEIYNWDTETWTTFSQKVPAVAGWVSNVIVSSLPNPYISATGTVRIRFKDSNRDATQHRLYIDQQYDESSDTFYVGGGSDDAHELLDESTFDSTNAYLTVRQYTVPASAFCGGFRFQSVTIPQNSSVSAAAFSGYVYSATYDNINCIIYGSDEDNAQDFNGNPHIVSQSDRPRTSASVSWVADDLGTGWKQKTGLEGIVEEIVGRAGWNSGNALVLLFIVGIGAEKRCTFYSYNQSSTYAAYLAVTWEEAAPPAAAKILRRMLVGVGL